MLQLLDAPPIDHFDAAEPDAEISEPDEPVFTKAALAELSPGRITAMSSCEIARALRDVSVLRFCDGRRLDFLDRTTLERLVYLARQCCRNQGY